jgi:UDP-glucose:(heptosyl)LPS alpha-1,3-glucosyltransferase
MNVAFCHENVVPSQGGCATTITNLARRLAADGHALHLYARTWDPAALPASMECHRIQYLGGPRFLRPWRFGAACLRALRGTQHDVTLGFDKAWGLDVLYPQGGLYAATADHNLLKHRHPVARNLLRRLKTFDPAHRSFLALERRQYLLPHRPLLVAISEMVRRHFTAYYGIPAQDVRLVRIAPDPAPFERRDRPRRRLECREEWGIRPEEVVALFAGMNYRLKGLVPLLHAVQRLPAGAPFRLLVTGSPDTAPFERLARRLRVAERVRFLGFWPDVADCYFAADLLVHPTFYDPCSHVVLEAMACGLPVITSRYNGASELLHPPREGFVLDDPHDHDHLAWCLGQLLDPARRTACAQAARRTAAGWTFDQHYRQMVQVLEEAAARRRAA